jgi:mannose/fructose/N-acetylgalactosamine-specific phosphotransferase system component IIB
MELKKLSDEMLEKNLTELVAKERSLLCLILRHVMEMARRRSYEKSHTTLFEYLTDLLKYSHGSAQRRRDAALLALEVPEVLQAVESGVLNLTQITVAQVGFRAIEKQTKKKVSVSIKQDVLLSIQNKSVAESEIIVSQKLGIKPKTKNKIKHQADGSVHVELTFSQIQWQKLLRAKELLSHSVPSGREDELITYMSERVIAYKDKTLPKAKRTPAKTGKGSRSEIPTGKPSSPTSEPEMPTKEIPLGKSDRPNYEILSESSTISSSEVPVGKSTSSSREIPIGKSSKSIMKDENGKFLRDSEIPTGIPIRPNGEIPDGKSDSVATRNSSPVPVRSAIPVTIQREVFARDKCCQYQYSSTGKCCGSHWQLQVDHIQPLWADGTNDLANLRVLCAKHNRQIYKEQSGLH